MENSVERIDQQCPDGEQETVKLDFCSTENRISRSFDPVFFRQVLCEVTVVE